MTRIAIRIAATILFLASAMGAWAMERVNVTCAITGNVVTQGLSSSNKAEIVYPQCKIAVYFTGTVNQATIYADNNQPPTPLNNPFTANTAGQGSFYVAFGRYDITLSGGGMPQPYTITDVLVQDVSEFAGTPGAPGPPNGSLQYNNNGVLAGAVGLTFDQVGGLTTAGNITVNGGAIATSFKTSTTGTTSAGLVMCVGANGLAVPCPVSSPSWIGISTQQSLNGNIPILAVGQTSCQFDGTPVAGDYVTMSATVIGNCHDAGAAFPSGPVVGQIVSYSSGTTATVKLNNLGPTGATGATGPAPNLTAGTTTTLPPGSQATTTVTGTNPNYQINMGVPTGSTGPMGPPGPPGGSQSYPGVTSDGNNGLSIPSGGVSSASTTSNVNSTINPQAPPYNAVGNGIADDSTAMQAACTAAKTHNPYWPIQLPSGSFYGDFADACSGVSFQGPATNNLAVPTASLIGKPGKDVYHEIDPSRTTGANPIQPVTFRDVGLLVNDTVDPNNRVATDGVTNFTTTVTSATMNFQASDVGNFLQMTLVQGALDPLTESAQIVSVTNSTTAVLSEVPIRGSTGNTFRIALANPAFPFRWPGRWAQTATTEQTATAGSPTITSSASMFSCGDVGQWLTVAGAGGTNSTTTLASNIDYSGAWASTTTYTAGQIVQYSAAYFVSLVNGNVGHLPNSANATYWSPNITITITAGATTWPQPLALIQIDSEIFRVETRGLASGATTLSVHRGENLTTPSAHTAGATVTIFNNLFSKIPGQTWCNGTSRQVASTNKTVTLLQNAVSTIANSPVYIGVNGYSPLYTVGNCAYAGDNYDGNTARWTATGRFGGNNYTMWRNSKFSTIDNLSINSSCDIMFQGYYAGYGLDAMNINPQRGEWNFLIVANYDGLKNFEGDNSSEDYQTWDHMFIQGINPIVVTEGLIFMKHLQIVSPNGPQFNAIVTASEAQVNGQFSVEEYTHQNGSAPHFMSGPWIMDGMQTGNGLNLDASSSICRNCVVSSGNVRASGTATLNANSAPWTNQGGANSNVNYGETSWPGGADGGPTVLSGLVAGENLILTVTGTATINGASHAPGDAVTGSSAFPGRFVQMNAQLVSVPTIVIGAFTDINGNVLPTRVGGSIYSVYPVGAGVTLLVPPNAVAFQLGINSAANTFSANSGSFSVTWSRTYGLTEISGMHNRIQMQSGASNYNGLVIDNGFNNIITNDFLPNIVVGGRAASTSDQRVTEVAADRTADFAYVNPYAPFRNKGDLWVWPQDMKLHGAQASTVTYVRDDNSESGYYALWPTASAGGSEDGWYSLGATPSSQYWPYIGGPDAVLPASKITLYLKAKCPVITSYTMNIAIRGQGPVTQILLGAVTVPCSPTYTTQSAVFDLTPYGNQNLYAVAQYGATGEMDVAWELWQPFASIPNIQSSVNKVLNVQAPPYNAQCDLVRGGNLTITNGVTPATGTGSYPFTAADVGKSINGMTNPSLSTANSTNGAPVSYSGTILSVTGGSATVSGSPTIALFYWKFGTDNTTAIQNAFNDALTQNATIMFPIGACLTSTIVWRGQSFYGSGSGPSQSVIVGQPGKDVFQVPDGNTNSWSLNNTSPFVRDVRIIVDNTVDASASPQNPAALGTFPNRIAGTLGGTVDGSAAPLNPPLAPGPAAFGTTYNGYNVACPGTISAGTLNQITIQNGPNGCPGNPSSLDYWRIIGAPITINGAGPGGSNLTTTITGVVSFNSSNNATTFSLAASASTTGTNFSGTMLNPLTPPWYIGNCGMAFPNSDGSKPTPNIATLSIFNVFIVAYGGPFQGNHSCGIFMQAPPYGSHFEELQIQSLYGGYVEALPAFNAGNLTGGTSTTWTGDTSSFTDDNMWFDTIPFLIQMGNHRNVSGLSVYGGVLWQNLGPIWINNNASASISRIYFECTSNITGEIARFSGASGINIAGGNTQQCGGPNYVGWMASRSTVDAGMGSLVIYSNANMNRFLHQQSPPTYITDNGIGNSFETNGNGGATAYPVSFYANSPKEPAGKLDGGFITSGNSGSPFVSGADLIFTCGEMPFSVRLVTGPPQVFYNDCAGDPNGTGLTKTYYKGLYANVPGGVWGTGNYGANGKPLVIGDRVPYASSMYWVLARCPSGPCSVIAYSTDVNTAGSGVQYTLNFGTAWTWQKWPFDMPSLSWVNPGDTIGYHFSITPNASWVAGSEFDVALVALAPANTDAAMYAYNGPAIGPARAASQFGAVTTFYAQFMQWGTPVGALDSTSPTGWSVTNTAPNQAMNVYKNSVNFPGSTDTTTGTFPAKYGIETFTVQAPPVWTDILNGALTATATTCVLTNQPPTTGSTWQANGYFQVDQEIIGYTGTPTSPSFTCTRGNFNTTAAAHNNGAAVNSVMTAQFITKCNNVDVSNGRGNIQVITANWSQLSQAFAGQACSGFTPSFSMSYNNAPAGQTYKVAAITLYSLSGDQPFPTAANQVLTSAALNCGTCTTGPWYTWGTIASLPLKVPTTITPAAVTSNNCAEQTFTVTGAATGQAVYLSPPSSMAAGDLWIGYARVTAANTVAVEFCTSGAGATPPSGSYLFVLY